MSMKKDKLETKEDKYDFREKARVLLIYRKMTPSVRMCGHTQLTYLYEQRKIEYRACKDKKVTKHDLNWADIVFLGRLDSWYERRLVELLHRAGRYLVYILDDDLLEIPDYVSSAAYFNQAEVQSNIKKMIEMSDAICSPSFALLRKYAIGRKKAILIEEPAISPVVYKTRIKKLGPIKIGFAGSMDRKFDVECILMDALIQVKKKYGDDVQIEFFGSIPSETERIGAKCIPYSNRYDEYKKRINDLEWDIGLAPMPDTSFHACKHYNKYIEYASAGIAGIYSNVPPYSRLREMKAPVMLCENTEKEWFDSICFLIDHIDFREKYRLKANFYVMERMSIKRTAESLKIEELVDELNDQKTVTIDSEANLMWLLKTIGYIKRVKSVVRKSIRRTLAE